MYLDLHVRIRPLKHWIVDSIYKTKQEIEKTSLFYVFPPKSKRIAEWPETDVKTEKGGIFRYRGWTLCPYFSNPWHSVPNYNSFYDQNFTFERELI